MGTLTTKQLAHASFDTFSKAHLSIVEKDLRTTDLTDKLKRQRGLVNTANKNNTLEAREKFKNIHG